MSDTSASNPYAAPVSALQEAPRDTRVPSIEEALSRGYDFTIGDVLNEAWQRTKGSKGIIVGGFLVFYAVMMVVSFALGGLFALLGLTGDSLVLGTVVEMVVGVFASALAYPFMAGIGMVGIRRAADQNISFNEIFSHFGRTVPILITAIACPLLIYLGLILLIIPGIYLAIAYSLAIPLVVERGLSPWQAMEASRKAVGQRWFKIFGLFLLLGLIVMISAIPLGIGLVWSMPLLIIAIGILYRTIFGVLPAPQ